MAVVALDAGLHHRQQRRRVHGRRVLCRRRRLLHECTRRQRGARSRRQQRRHGEKVQAVSSRQQRALHRRRASTSKRCHAVGAGGASASLCRSGQILTCAGIGISTCLGCQLGVMLPPVLLGAEGCQLLRRQRQQHQPLPVVAEPKAAGKQRENSGKTAEKATGKLRSSMRVVEALVGEMRLALDRHHAHARRQRRRHVVLKKAATRQQHCGGGSRGTGRRRRARRRKRRGGIRKKPQLANGTLATQTLKLPPPATLKLVGGVVERRESKA